MNLPENSAAFADSTDNTYLCVVVTEPAVKKTAKRVKWADHFGQPIKLEQTVEGEFVEGNTVDSSVSWTDRKKRDRMREKELLAKAK